MLKNVVLPAPFGPIRLTIEPRSIVKSTSLTATRPPNSLRSCSICEQKVVPSLFLGRVTDVHQRLVVHAGLELELAPRLGDQALRTEEHH